ncbi:MAG: hypothetical protein JXA49_03490 [Actinobacteria bacterium]|nr:hypothetical protein [Actinomycetota bacterium]
MAENELTYYRPQVMPPVGDFIALIGGFLAMIFPLALHWYSMSGGKATLGIGTINGIISFVIGLAIFATSMVMLVGRFLNPNFRIPRSPGWIYASAASVVFMVSILGMVVVPSSGGQKFGISAGIVFEIMAALVIGVGGMLKFDSGSTESKNR